MSIYILTLYMWIYFVLNVHKVEALLYSVQNSDHSSYSYSAGAVVPVGNQLCLTSVSEVGALQKYPSSRRGAIKHGTQRFGLQRGLCPCGRIYCPVCGTDGTTYGNLCFLRCAQHSHAGLKIVKNGVC